MKILGSFFDKGVLFSWKPFLFQFLISLFFLLPLPYLARSFLMVFFITSFAFLFGLKGCFSSFGFLLLVTLSGNILAIPTFSTNEILIALWITLLTGLGVTIYHSPVTTENQCKEEDVTFHEKMESIFDNLEEMVLYLDLQMTILWVNATTGRWLGINPEHLVGRKCYEVWQKRKSPCPSCHVIQATEKKRSISKEIKTPDNQWLLVTGKPVKDEGGRVVGVLETILDITENYRTEEKMKEQEIQNRALLAAIPDFMLLLDRKGTILKVKAGDRNYGLPEDIVSQDIFSLFPQEVGKNIYENLQEVFANKDSRIFNFQLLEEDERRTFECRMVLCGEEKVLSIIRDISKEKKAIKEMNRMNEEMRMLLDNIELQVYYLFDEKTYGRVNQAYQKFLGLPREEIEYQEISKVLLPNEALLSISNNRKVFTQRERLYSEEYITNRRGERRLLAITRTPNLKNCSQVEYVICAAEDITQKRDAEDKIRFMSFHDALTGLYNRHYIEEEMERLNTRRQLPVSLIMADLNGLKLINDTLGHNKGDELIKRGASLLKNTCRQEDIIARWGGDEFLILLPRTDIEMVKSIVNRLKINCKLSEGDLPLSIAFGGATRETLEDNMEKVIKEAEERMYRNKLKSTRNTRSRILNVLLKVLEEKSYETEVHAWRLQKMAFEIGDTLNLNTNDLDRLSLLVSLHDIGKITISKEILKKESILSISQWETVKTHSEVGYRIALSSEDFSHIAEEILAHHENWNGSGYPRGLKGEEIPLLSRITHIIDAFDRMTENTSYRMALSKGEALSELQKSSGSQFDPYLVEVFMEIYS